MGVLIRRQNVSCQACHPISAQIRRSNRDSRQRRPVPSGLRTDAMNTYGNSPCHTSLAIISIETTERRRNQECRQRESKEPPSSAGGHLLHILCL